MRSRCALQGAHNPHALGAAERAREPRVLCVLCGLRPACLLTAAAHGCCSRLLLTAAGARTQGYLKKVRPGETTRYTGYLCRRDIHEFLFAETPVDEAAPPSSSAAAAQRLGCVAVTVFATRRVRVEDSSSDDEQGHSSSGAITATRLPEKQAVKEYGVQARAGGPVERVPRYRRRRLHLPISPCISLYLPVSPCISPYLPISP